MTGWLWMAVHQGHWGVQVSPSTISSHFLRELSAWCKSPTPNQFGGYVRVALLSPTRPILFYGSSRQWFELPSTHRHTFNFWSTFACFALLACPVGSTLNNLACISCYLTNRSYHILPSLKLVSQNWRDHSQEIYLYKISGKPANPKIRLPEMKRTITETNPHFFCREKGWLSTVKKQGLLPYPLEKVLTKSVFQGNRQGS